MKFCINFISRLGVGVVLLAGVFGNSCQSHQIQVNLSKAITPPRDTTGIVVCTMPADSLDSVFQGLSSDRVFEFYNRRHGKLAWTSCKQLSASADSLLYFISHAIDVGLNRDNYHYAELRNAKEKLHVDEIVQRMDALLTDAFLLLAADLKYGATSCHAPGTRQRQLLEDAVYNGSPITFLQSQEPTTQAYRLLRKAMRKSADSLAISNYFSDTVDAGSDADRLLSALAVNMERWRLDSTFVDDKFVFINIPAFTLEVVSNDTVRFESRIIVGTPDKPTPVLSSWIECIITYPYWHVPRKISVEEFLPQIRKNITFLSQNNFDVLDRKGNILNADSVNWATFTEDYFPVSLRQREGTDNSLGILKFVFDNPYAVYVHDTNTKYLFKNTVRAYSHGCIRIEQAESFAHYLITGSSKMRSNVLTTLLKQKEKHNITLTRRIPIYIRYLTCEVKGEKIHLYPDVYKYDRSLLEKLRKRDRTIL